MRRALVLLLAAAVVVGVVVGVRQAADRTPPQRSTAPYDLRAGLDRLDGSPAPLARLHAQAAQLLEGGLPAFDKRLAALRGRPVVVNVWAHWCGPCRLEFPVFQRAATRWGTRVAFLGVATQDSAGRARRYLRDEPVPYPSYLDPDGEPLVRRLGLPQGPVPLTAFIGANGKPAFTKSGNYVSEAELDADIERYLRP